MDRGILSVAAGSAPSWGLRILVRGEDCGVELEYPTRSAAEAEAKERTKKYGALGCYYRVVPPLDHCKSCLEKGHYVRTRIFEGGNKSDVYECANEQCRSEGLLWHVDLPNAH